MENIVFTQLSVTEIRQLFREELETYFDIQSESTSKSQTDEFLTIQQAANLLCLSVPTLYGLVSKSQLPVSKKGKRLYFSKLELTGWIKEGRKRTVAECAKEAQDFIQSKKR